MASHWIVMEHAPQSYLTYEQQQIFYARVKSDIEAMVVRARSLDQTPAIQIALQRLQDNFAYLVLMHKKCLSSSLTEGQRQKISDRGADLSMSCRIAYGAQEELDARGQLTLKRAMIPIVRDTFNLQLGALMRQTANRQQPKRVPTWL
jgi:hypothetical protein